MFFPKLRRKAKWVFAVIAAAFGLSFVVAGVGSGFGSGIGDYLAELFDRQPGAGGGPSVGAARERVEENPDDPEAQLELASALQAEGSVDEAIAAFERYTELRPDDDDALQQLASLYLVKAGNAERRARDAQLVAAQAYFSNEIYDPQNELTQNLVDDPISNYRRQVASEAYSSAITEAQETYRKEAAVWQRLTELDPEEASFAFELARSSQQSGDVEGAIAGYERFLELSPEAGNAEQVEELIEALKAQRAGPAAAAPGG